jgi:hypothetical protein
VLRFILRAGVLAALLVLPASAQANPNASATARVPEAVCGIDAAFPQADPAPPWMTDALYGAFDCPTGAISSAFAPVGMPITEHRPQPRPHQNPANPAAFVFQSHSSLFLAADTNARHTPRRGPIGS